MLPKILTAQRKNLLNATAILTAPAARFAMTALVVGRTLLAKKSINTLLLKLPRGFSSNSAVVCSLVAAQVEAMSKLLTEQEQFSTGLKKATTTTILGR